MKPRSEARLKVEARPKAEAGPKVDAGPKAEAGPNVDDVLTADVEQAGASNADTNAGKGSEPDADNATKPDAEGKTPGSVSGRTTMKPRRAAKPKAGAKPNVEAKPNVDSLKADGEADSASTPGTAAKPESGKTDADANTDSPGSQADKAKPKADKSGGKTVQAEPISKVGAETKPESDADAKPSGGGAAGGRPGKPPKATRAAARLAVAEPAVAGLVVPKRTRPAIPEQPAPDAAALGVPTSRSGRWWWRTACAVGLLGFLASIALGIVRAADIRADAKRSARPVLSASPVPSAPPKPFLSVGTGVSAGLLVLANGQVLYYNDQDGAPPSGVPACVDSCSKVWRPLAPSDDVPLAASPDVIGSLYTIVRPQDGTTQVTFNGHPLYEFTVDGPGHMTGNGLNDVFAGQAFSWHAANATDTPVIPAPSADPTLPVPIGTPTDTPTASPSASVSVSPTPNATVTYR